jgi:hypothetical protein
MLSVPDRVVVATTPALAAPSVSQAIASPNTSANLFIFAPVLAGSRQR